ncbi:UNVERIFIED_CONTAM: hypothetical protein NY100_06415 [Prevotella sp. 15_C9]
MPTPDVTMKSHSFPFVVRLCLTTHGEILFIVIPLFPTVAIPFLRRDKPCVCRDGG